MSARKSVDGLAALLVGYVGHAARVDDADVGRLVFFGWQAATLRQLVAQSGRLGKVQLAAKGHVGRFPAI